MAITIVKKKQLNLNVPAAAGESTNVPGLATPGFAAAAPAEGGSGKSFTLYAILALVAVAVYAVLLAIQWMELSY